MGVAWAQAQAFTGAQKDEVRVVARLAADALGRAQMLEAERAARERTERLQRTMTALVASASLAEAAAAVCQHGLPFGASAARLALVDQQQPELLVTLNAAGTPCSNLLAASSRTSSRRLRPSAVSPPPCAYRMPPQAAYVSPAGITN